MSTTLIQPPHSSLLKLDINQEAPFIKVVQECIVKTFKSHKKFIEKEVSSVVNKITLVKKAGSAKGAASVIESIDSLILKLNQLKIKYNKLVEAEDYLVDVMRKRLIHLSTVVENQSNPDVMKNYFIMKLNRTIIDYLLRENYFESAKIFIQETGLQDFVDVEIFEETSRILDKLKHRDCKEALDWCSTHKTKLQKSNSKLEFKLRIQELVELIKQNEIMKAVEYAKKQLQKFDQEKEYLDMMGQVMGSFVFRSDRRLGNLNFKYFSDDKRWEEIEEMFTKESFSLYGQPEISSISQTLQTGIPVLKMEFCMNDATLNEQCPTCSINMRKLGKKLPYSHQTQTSIQCKVTGELMNDENHPVYLPTGYVVSERAIEKMVDVNNITKLVCPFTSQVICKADVRKVFFS